MYSNRRMARYWARLQVITKLEMNKLEFRLNSNTVARSLGFAESLFKWKYELYVGQGSYLY